MKNTFLSGLLAALTFSVYPLQGFAQSYVVENDLAFELTDSAGQRLLVDTNVAYTSVGLSDPAMYAGETFRLFLKVKNTGLEERVHTVNLFQQTNPGTGKIRLHYSQELTLSPGGEEEIVLPLIPEELARNGDPVEKNFVFFLGKFEIGLECVW